MKYLTWSWKKDSLLAEGQAAAMVHTHANSKVSLVNKHNRSAPPCRKAQATGGLTLISPPWDLPHTRGTYSNLKPSCLLQCCKIYKRITSLNRLALQTQMQTSRSPGVLGRRGNRHRELWSQTLKWSLRWGASLSDTVAPCVAFLHQVLGLGGSLLLSGGLLLLRACLVTLKITQSGWASRVTCRNTSGSTWMNTVQCFFSGLQGDGFSTLHYYSFHLLGYIFRFV